MDHLWWNELIEFIIDKTSLSRQRVKHILDIHTPEPLPQPLQEVLQDVLMEKKVTREGVSPLTQYRALNALLDLEAEEVRKESLRLEVRLEDGGLADSDMDEMPELFLEYSNLIEEICSKTGEDEETIHQVHRAYLEYVYMKTNDPETLIPFLKWYLKSEENINLDF